MNGETETRANHAQMLSDNTGMNSLVEVGMIIRPTYRSDLGARALVTGLAPNGLEICWLTEAGDVQHGRDFLGNHFASAWRIFSDHSSLSYAQIRAIEALPPRGQEADDDEEDDVETVSLVELRELLNAAGNVPDLSRPQSITELIDQIDNLFGEMTDDEDVLETVRRVIRNHAYYRESDSFDVDDWDDVESLVEGLLDASDTELGQVRDELDSMFDGDQLVRDMRRLIEGHDGWDLSQLHNGSDPEELLVDLLDLADARFNAAPDADHVTRNVYQGVVNDRDYWRNMFSEHQESGNTEANRLRTELAARQATIDEQAADLAQARQLAETEPERIEAAIEERLITISDELGAIAQNAGYCDTYDRYAEQAGLYGRMRTWTVTLDIAGSNQTFHVDERSQDKAVASLRPGGANYELVTQRLEERGIELFALVEAYRS